MTCANRGGLHPLASRTGFHPGWIRRFQALALLVTGITVAASSSTLPAAVTSPSPAADKAAPGLIDENAPATVEDTLHEGAGSETGRAAESSPLLRDAAAVVSGRFEGIDTATLFTGIQEKAKWGEIPDRLLEAQGILLWNRGDWHMAIVTLRRLSKPGPQSMGILAEGLLRKGDRYEAAAQFLKAARAYPPADDRSNALYRSYLTLKPGDASVEAELAGRLETQGNASEAAVLRLKDPKRAAANPASALRVGAMLAGQGHEKEAIALYRLAIETSPADKPLRVALATACENLGRRLEAGQAWADAWHLDSADIGPRDRALAHFEASGAGAEAPLRKLLESAVALDGGNHRLRFKLAVACLASDDRTGAYVHLDEALRAAPGNPTYMSRLPEAIEGDSLILAHFPYLKSEFESKGGSVRLVELAARGYSLSGKPAEACRAWFQLHTMAPQNLQNHRDAVVDLAACGDPAYLSLAGRLAEPLAEKSQGDRELSGILLKAHVQDGEYDKASVVARKLLKAFPEESGEVLAAAKAMLSMEHSDPARDVLLDLSRTAPTPEASLLLGGILHAQKDCPSAVDHLEAASDAFPVAFWLMGECLEGLKDPLRASLAYQAYYSRTGDKESLLALARVHRAVGDPAKEKETLETLLSKGWAGEAEKLRLGLVHAASGDTDKAVSLFTELHRDRTTIPSEAPWVDAGLILGTRLAAEGKHDRAIRVLSIALRADAGRTAGWRLLGDCQVARRQWKVAFASYSGAAASGGSSLELARIQVEVALKLDKKEMAQAYIELSRFDTTSSEANAFLASHYQAERNYKDAAIHFGRILREKPEDGKVWESLGNCLALVPDMDRAGEALQNALDLGIESDEVYVNRARAYRHDGAKDMAASILEFLITRNSRSYLALVWSAKFAEEDGRPDLAMELFKKVSRLSPPRTAWPELASQGVTSASATP